MFRGEFEIGGKRVPNNITTWGAEQILKAAFQNQALPLYLGLCSATYAPDLTLAQIEEPTIGVRGYSRILLNQTPTDWPTIGNQLGSSYVQSRPVTFTPSGVGFDQPVTRLFICGSLNSLTSEVFALSSVIDEPVTIVESFNIVYRLFAR